MNKSEQSIFYNKLIKNGWIHYKPEIHGKEVFGIIKGNNLINKYYNILNKKFPYLLFVDTPIFQTNDKIIKQCVLRKLSLFLTNPFNECNNDLIGQNVIEHINKIKLKYLYQIDENRYVVLGLVSPYSCICVSGV